MIDRLPSLRLSAPVGVRQTVPRLRFRYKALPAAIVTLGGRECFTAKPAGDNDHGRWAALRYGTGPAANKPISKKHLYVICARFEQRLDLVASPVNPGFHRSEGQPEDLGDFFVRKLLVVAQKCDHAVVRR